MKRFLVTGIIVILSILTLIVLVIKRTENNTVVDNITNSVVESTIENDVNTTDKTVSDNEDVDTYSYLLLDKDIYDKDGEWRSSQFSIPGNTHIFNLYYQNNGKHKTEIVLYRVNNSGKNKVVYRFTVSPAYRATYHPIVYLNNDYYVSIQSVDGGSIDGNIRAGVSD